MEAWKLVLRTKQSIDLRTLTDAAARARFRFQNARGLSYIVPLEIITSARDALKRGRQAPHAREHVGSSLLIYGPSLVWN